MCYGTGCRVSFTSVQFTRSTLVVAAGAQVTLQDATFAHPRSSGSGIAIFAHGSRTSVNLNGGRVTGGAQGATVQVRVRQFMYHALYVCYHVACAECCC